MTEIQFDIKGNPTPPGIREIDLSVIKDIYVDSFTLSNTRTTIFDSYLKFNVDLKKTANNQTLSQYVNGSFTTTKIDPNDIDIVNLINIKSLSISAQQNLINFTTKGGCKNKYLVDSYIVPIYPKDDERFELTERWLNYWKDFFGKDRDGNKKTLFIVRL